MKRPAAAQRTECPTKRQAPAKAEPTLKKPSSTRSITKRPAVAQLDHGRGTLPKPCKVKQVEPKALPGPSRNCEILSLIKETRARIEAFLGWAMLLRFGVCCEASVTLATQRQLAEVLQVAWPPSHAASCSWGAHVFSRTTSCGLIQMEHDRGAYVETTQGLAASTNFLVMETLRTRFRWNYHLFWLRFRIFAKEINATDR